MQTASNQPATTTTHTVRVAGTATSRGYSMGKAVSKVVTCVRYRAMQVCGTTGNRTWVGVCGAGKAVLLVTNPAGTKGANVQRLTATGKPTGKPVVYASIRSAHAAHLLAAYKWAGLQGKAIG